MEAPSGMPTPNLNPTLECVISLTCQYFLVYLMLFVTQTLSQMWSSPGIESFGRVLVAAEKTVKFCPMLALLFLGARMRAEELSKHGSPQCFAQDGMYFSSYAVLVQLLMVLSLGLFSEVSQAQGATSDSLEVDDDGNIRLIDESNPASKKPVGRMVAEGVRYVAFLGLYGGATAVVASVLMIRPNTALCERRPW